MQFLSLKQLRQKLAGRSRTAIYADMAAGRLPPPIRLGKRLLWAEAAVDARLRELAAEAPKRGAREAMAEPKQSGAQGAL
jgi:predicted DNA-binding transcriptional regulator AlpA